MPKAAIVNIEREDQLEKTSFKQLSLLFDSIYVDQKDLVFGRWDIEMSKLKTTEEKRIILAEVDWLMEKNILKTYFLPRGKQGKTISDPLLLNDIEKLDETIRENVIHLPEADMKETKPGDFRLAGVLKIDNQTLFNVEDIRTRIGAAYLGSENPLIEFIPIVSSFGSYIKRSSKDLATHVILDSIPVPDPITSWEELIDFRNDEDMKRKYYALINWVNDIAKADLPLHVVVDKYNQLYSEYLHQYKLHKIGSKLTKIEILISYGSEVISSLLQKGLVSAFKGVVNVSQKHVALLKDEKNIQGRELSYLLKVKERFGHV